MMWSKCPPRRRAQTMQRARGLGVLSGTAFGVDQAVDPSESPALVNPAVSCPAGEEYDSVSLQCVTRGQAIAPVTPPVVGPLPPLPAPPPIPMPGPPPPPSPAPLPRSTLMTALPYVAGAVVIVGAIALVRNA